MERPSKFPQGQSRHGCLLSYLGLAPPAMGAVEVWERFAIDLHFTLTSHISTITIIPHAQGHYGVEKLILTYMRALFLRELSFNAAIVGPMPLLVAELHPSILMPRRIGC
jgi:hypothetical protein